MDSVAGLAKTYKIKERTKRTFYIVSSINFEFFRFMIFDFDNETSNSSDDVICNNVKRGEYVDFVGFLQKDCLNLK